MKLYINKRHYVRQAIHFCVILFWAWMITACDDSNETPIPTTDGEASLTLHVETPTKVTRVNNVPDEAYAAFENRINTLRIIVLSESGSLLKNEPFTVDELASTSGEYKHTINGLPIGKVRLYLVANEAAIGKDYSQDTSDFTEGLVDAISPTTGQKVKKLLITDEERNYFPKRYTEFDGEKDALPMSAQEPNLTLQTGENTASLTLVRSVAKLRIEMVNELTRPITVNEMSFGKFMSDRFYLFRDLGLNLDVPSDANYATLQYGDQDDSNNRLGINIEGGATRVLVLYIYPSYAWREGDDSTPYTIGFRTPNATYNEIGFLTNKEESNSIARNKQIILRALLHTESNFSLNFTVEDWDEKAIKVPSFD